MILGTYGLDSMPSNVLALPLLYLMMRLIVAKLSSTCNVILDEAFSRVENIEDNND